MELCSRGAYGAVKGVRFFISQRLALQNKSQIVGALVEVLQRNRARANGRDGEKDGEGAEKEREREISQVV